MKERIKGKKQVAAGIAVMVLVLLIILLSVVFILKEGESEIALNDSEGELHGWSYEVLEGTGIREYEPAYVDGYTLDFGDMTPEAVRISRCMTEQVENAQLCFRLNQSSGIEVFLDGSLLYSDFADADRSENGFLLLGGINQYERIWSVRELRLTLPEDYVGQTLSVVTYFLSQEVVLLVEYPSLVNDSMYFSFYKKVNILPAFIMSFFGFLAVALCMIYVIGLFNDLADHRILLLVAFFIMLLIDQACSVAGDLVTVPWILSAVGRAALYPLAVYIALFLRPWRRYCMLAGFSVFFFIDILCYARDRMAGKVFTDGNSAAYMTAMWIIVVMVMAEVIQERKKWKRYVSWRSCLLVILTAAVSICYPGFWMDFGSVSLYLKNIMVSASFMNFKPIIQIFMMIYVSLTVILLSLEYIRGSLERQKQFGILEFREQSAVENCRILRYADEETKKVRHEMRHHLTVLTELIRAEQIQRSEEYIGAVLEEVERLPSSTYSHNMIVNAIVANYLNRAKQKGIAVDSEIRIEEELPVRDQDLCVLLTNVLENALEACSAMSGESDRYIRLRLKTEGNLLYLECENSTEKKEWFNNTEKSHSARANRGAHGYGLLAIERVVADYCGEVKFSEQNGVFRVRALLQLEGAGRA